MNERYCRVPSRVQARDERCEDPGNCDIPGHGPGESEYPPGDMHEPKAYTGELDWGQNAADYPERH